MDEAKTAVTQESPKAEVPKAAGPAVYEVVTRKPVEIPSAEGTEHQGVRASEFTPAAHSLGAKLTLHPGDRLRAISAEAERLLAKLVVDGVLKALRR